MAPGSMASQKHIARTCLAHGGILPWEKKVSKKVAKNSYFFLKYQFTTVWKGWRTLWLMRRTYIMM
jgi:hypothetical protein